MDSIKNNKVLATLFWLGLGGAIALGVFAYLAYNSYQESLISFDAVKNRLSKTEGAEIYPSAENETKLADQVNAYETSVQDLTKILLKLQQPAEPIVDTVFQSKLKERISAIRTEAETAKMALPKSFNLGFDSYTTGLPKSPEAARQLNDYFLAVDSIVQACIKAGVVSVDSLARSQIEVEKPDAPPPPPPSQAEQRRSKSKARTKGKAAAPAVELTKVTERRTVKLDLTLDQPALMALLNYLADANQMLYFTVVRLVHTENEKMDGPHKGTAIPVVAAEEEKPVVAPKPNEDGTPAAPVKEVITAPKPSAPDALAILGHEKLKAHLEIDIVRYQEPSK